MRTPDGDAISANLKRLEQGEFQAFCLSFLPLWDEVLKGLVRHGATSQQKTRPGIPDLLLTTADGQQIAVQCSAAQDYWNVPRDTDKYPSWKPIADVIVCQQALEKLSRVVLCCSQEIPTNRSSAKSTIITYCRDKLGVTVEPLSNEDIEGILVLDTLKFRGTIQEYLGDASNKIYGDRDTAAARLAVALGRMKLGGFDEILSAAYEAVDKHGPAPVGQLIDEVSTDLASRKKSRFRYQPPGFLAIRRPYNWDVVGGSPIGRVIALRGVPDIGKTFLLRQLAEDHGFSESSIEHLLCTFAPGVPDSEKILFVRDALFAISEHTIPPQRIEEHLKSLIDWDTLLRESAPSPANVKLVILDNSERLDAWSLRQIDDYLVNAKTRGLLRDKGVIFVSWRSMLGKVNSLDAEYTAPDWTKDEISSLLDVHGIQIDNRKEAYVALLTAFVHGHPRVALAFARQNPSFRQLDSLWGARKQTPLYDAAFNDEVKSLLHNDLINSDDLRHLMRVASSLVFPFSADLLEALVQVLKLPLVRPVRALLPELTATVLETVGQGKYSVAPLYGEVSAADEPVDRRIQIRGAAGDILYSIKDGVIDGMEACDGVFYSLSAGQFTKAFYRAGLLLSALDKEHTDSNVVQYFLDRLDIVRLVSPTAEKDAWRTYAMMIMGLYIHYTRLEAKTKKRECIDSLRAAMSTVPEDERASDKLYQVLIFIVRGHEFFTAMAEEKWDDSLEIVDSYPVSDDFSELRVYEGILELLPGIIQRSQSGAIPTLFLRRVAQATESTQTERVATLFRCALGIGSTLRAKQLDPRTSVHRDVHENSLWSVFVDTVHAQYLAEVSNEPEALALLQPSMAQLRNLTEHWEVAGRHLLVLEADINYRLDRRDEAKSLYMNLAGSIDPAVDPFHSAWCHFRAALLEEDLLHARSLYERCSPILLEHGSVQEHAIAIGESAVIDFLEGRKSESIRGFAYLLDKYFEDHNEAFGPAAWAAGNLLSNLTRNEPPMLEDWKDDSGNTFLGLRRGAFLLIRRDARPSMRKIITYKLLSDVCKKHGLKSEYKEVLNRIINETPATDVDVFAQVDACFWLGASFREKADLQFRYLLRLVVADHSATLLSAFGRMLLAVWSYYRYRRLSASDLPYWKALGENATTINVLAVPVEHKYAAMTLLLLSISEEDHGPAVAALRDQLRQSLRDVASQFPEDISGLLK